MRPKLGPGPKLSGKQGRKGGSKGGREGASKGGREVKKGESQGKSLIMLME